VLPPPQTAESKGDGKINVRNEQIWFPLLDKFEIVELNTRKFDK
jgi:hypothetical protein